MTLNTSSVIGQDRAKEALRRALEQGRLGHARLFTGPDGVGKTLLARETAQALLCSGPPDAAPGRAKRGRTAGCPSGERPPCDVCRDCLLFAHDAHPDFLLLQPEGASRVIKIEQIFDLIRTFSRMPVQSERRVAVIREADALKEEAANALLKTLEEPPAYAYLILTTSRLRSLPPTVRSRCQEIRFAPLSPDQVRAVLNLPEIRESLLDVEAQDVQAAVSLANGSADRALQLLESGCLEIRRKSLQRVLALPDGDVFEIAGEVMEWVKEASKALEPQRERLRGFLYLLESAYRDLLVLSVGGDRETLLHPPDAAAAPAARARDASPERLWRMEEAVWEARRQTDANASMELLLQNLLLRLSALQKTAIGS